MPAAPPTLASRAVRLRRALLLLAQDARDMRDDSTADVSRAMMAKIAERDGLTIPQVAAWLRGQLDDPDEPGPLPSRPLTEADVRRVVCDELRLARSRGNRAVLTARL